jgi:hypothetical protein
MLTLKDVWCIILIVAMWELSGGERDFLKIPDTFLLRFPEERLLSGT